MKNTIAYRYKPIIKMRFTETKTTHFFRFLTSFLDIWNWPGLTSGRQKKTQYLLAGGDEKT